MLTNGVQYIGDYNVHRILGKGAQAQVYLASNSTGTFSAIKVFNDPRNLTPEVVNLQGLSHPNLIKLLEA